MFSQFRKEIVGFFYGLTGYIVMMLFLILNGLFMWVFPGENNVLDIGVASMNSLFSLSPLLFLLLTPAVTMRMFAEERRSGTLELLLTRPFTEHRLVIAKFFAAFVLTVIALIPTVVYLVSLNTLGDIDVGATAGSYIGLLFLTAVYTSVGLFSSALTSNQIVSFLLSAVLCFVLYLGFDFISTIPGLQNLEMFFVNIGLNEHYISISRGVIDIRDVIYFTGIVVVFISATVYVVKRR
ncbi:MAG: ABC transporter permease subunit [Bacteroidales bacterium]|jgi:ABC-2 type transport system permease protein|nr:ABC transporter permease subunit [Bacteroidales bacterium]